MTKLIITSKLSRKEDKRNYFSANLVISWLKQVLMCYLSCSIYREYCILFSPEVIGILRNVVKNAIHISHALQFVIAISRKYNEWKTLVSGDGNVHLNITVHEFTQDVYKLIEPYIFEHTSRLKGSVSAEHGIGFKKPKFLGYSKSKEAIEMMKRVKYLIDPNGILNPYKVLP